MPGGSKKSFYGVRVGRAGPRVYQSWPECQAAVEGFPNSQFKGFVTSREAEVYVNESQNWVDNPSQLPPLREKKSPTRVSPPNAEKGVSKPVLLTPRSPTKQSQCPPKMPMANPAIDNEDMDVDPAFWDSDDSQTKFCTATALSGPSLSQQQLQVLELVKKGENIFFTGSAGTGKSVLLRAIITTLGGPSTRLAVTASTGIASVNIGGTTLHSFAGIGLGKEPVDKLVGKIRGQKALEHVWDRWRKTKVLIIDEVSMIDGTLFDKLESIARQLRNDNRPFGGIQLILTGDFCQLPPVPDLHDGVQLPVLFAFDASSWDSCIGTPIVLNKVFRQDDQSFVRMLNEMRYGRLDNTSAERFAALSRSVVYTDGIEPTELFPLRREVETANARRLASLPDPSHTYTSLDVSGRDIRGQPISARQAEKLLERLVAVKTLTLKVGAQVMLIQNLVQGRLVNGSLGQVVAFKSVAQAQHDRDEIAKIDTSQDSNDKNRPVQKNRGEVDPKSMDKISGKKRVWPLVRFTNGSEALCIPVEFTVQNVNGEAEVKRDQVPLILAWALSVHKSQGQTIERVKVNLARTFEKGQAYVALSRATNMETLQVLNFDKSKVMAHPRVLEWHASLMRKLDYEEEQAIVHEMDDEEALKAFFEDDDMF